jgi:hypothetical protein
MGAEAIGSAFSINFLIIVASTFTSNEIERLKEMTGVGNQAMRTHEGLAVCLWLRRSGKVTREEPAGRIKRTDVRWSPCPVM